VIHRLLLVALAVAAPYAAFPGAGTGTDITRVKVERSVRLAAGHASRSFRFRLRAAYADRVRLVVPHGAAVWAVARSADGLLGIGVSTRPWREQCRRAGRVDVCEQPQEWCPLSDYRWRVTVRKTSAAPTLVRVRFVFVRPSG
jgi:hypothetical protein